MNEWWIHCTSSKWCKCERRDYVTRWKYQTSTNRSLKQGKQTFPRFYAHKICFCSCNKMKTRSKAMYPLAQAGSFCRRVLRLVCQYFFCKFCCASCDVCHMFIDYFLLFCFRLCLSMDWLPGPKIVCFLTQSVQLTLSSVQLTLLECVMWSSKIQWRFPTVSSLMMMFQSSSSCTSSSDCVSCPSLSFKNTLLKNFATACAASSSVVVSWSLSDLISCTRSLTVFNFLL